MAGRDCGGRRAGGRLSDFHVDHRQAAALARICETIDLDRVERRDPVGGAIHAFNPSRISASTRARSSGVSTPGPGASAASATAIERPIDNARNCSRRSRSSSADAGAAASARKGGYTVGVEADVAPRAPVALPARRHGGGAIAIPGNRRTTEIKRHPVGARHDLHHVGIVVLASVAMGVASVAIAAAGFAARRPAACAISECGSIGSSPCTFTTTSSPDQPRRAAISAMRSVP